MFYEVIKGFFSKSRSVNSNEIDYQTACTMLKNNKDCILIDVRSPQEYKEGHLDGSINLPFYNVTRNVKDIIKDENTSIILYCQTGGRSKRVINMLYKMGYRNLYNIAGGFEGVQF